MTERIVKDIVVRLEHQLGRPGDCVTVRDGEIRLIIAEFHSTAAMRSALEGLLYRYVGLVESGDAGNWNAETEPCVINSRAALKGQ